MVSLPRPPISAKRAAIVRMVAAGQPQLEGRRSPTAAPTGGLPRRRTVGPRNHLRPALAADSEGPAAHSLRYPEQRPPWRAFSKPMPRCRRPEGDFGPKPPVQSAGGPDMLRSTGSLNRRVGKPDRGAHESQLVAHDRRTASRNRHTWTSWRRVRTRRYEHLPGRVQCESGWLRPRRPPCLHSCVR